MKIETYGVALLLGISLFQSYRIEQLNQYQRLAFPELAKLYDDSREISQVEKLTIEMDAINEFAEDVHQGFDVSRQIETEKVNALMDKIRQRPQR